MMTKLEVIKLNKKQYAELEASIPAMSGLEKAVAQYVTLAWIKGTKWMGGLSDSAADRAYSKVMAMGYTWDEVDTEFCRQAGITF